MIVYGQVLSAVLGVSHLFVGMQLITIFGHQLFSGMNYMYSTISTMQHIVTFEEFANILYYAPTSDFGEESVIMGLLLVLLAQLLGTGVFMVYIDTMGRRVLLLAGTFYCRIFFI